ncbi:hypothetical protein ZWY2020_037799 [Hordeum vulgare]|nr:hypothetical protein ZWY2020_037799 [Hordeum vulgare]
MVMSISYTSVRCTSEILSPLSCCLDCYPANGGIPWNSLQDLSLRERYIMYAKPRAEYEHFTCILIEA